jgi:RNA polymerase sigma-70 factor (ECF subfamily)
MKNGPQHALIRRAQKGDHGAFEELLNAHYGSVFSLLCKWTGHWHDAEDLTQETFLKAYKYLRSFRPNEVFKNWIFRIALNLAHEHHSAGKRRARSVEELDEKVYEQLTSGPALVEDKMRRDEMLRQVYRAIPNLTERERSVFVLKTMEGMENDEVARTLGISQTTVRRFYGLARRKILDEIRKGEALA